MTSMFYETQVSLWLSNFTAGIKTIAAILIRPDAWNNTCPYHTVADMFFSLFFPYFVSPSLSRSVTQLHAHGVTGTSSEMQRSLPPALTAGPPPAAFSLINTPSLCLSDPHMPTPGPRPPAPPAPGPQHPTHC